MRGMLWGAVAALCLSSVVQAAYFAYAPADDADNNDATEELLVVDGSYASRVTSVDIPGGTSSYTVSADGKRVFLANDQGITILDATRNRIVTTLSLSGAPQVGRVKAQQRSSDERLFLSSNVGLIVLEGDPDRLDYTPIQTISTAAGTGLALSPDQTRLLTSGGDAVAWVNPATLEEVARLDLGESAGQLAFHPQDPERAYLLLPDSRRLATLTLSDSSLTVEGYFSLGSQSNPRNLVLTPDGTILIADHGIEQGPSDSSSGLVLKITTNSAGLPIDLTTIDVSGSLIELSYTNIPPPHFPVDLGLSPDGTRLFVTQSVWSQEGGIYLSIFQESGGQWSELGRVRIGESAYGVGDLVGPECAECPRGYQPKVPEPYTRPAALHPGWVLALLPLAWRRLHR